MKGIHQPKKDDQIALYQAVRSLKNIKEYEDFFRDLLTIEEMTEFSKRWLAARLISAKRSYREVAAQTGLSTTTVARVAHWLNNGRGGYRLAIKRLKLND